MPPSFTALAWLVGRCAHSQITAPTASLAALALCRAAHGRAQVDQRTRCNAPMAEAAPSRRALGAGSPGRIAAVRPRGLVDLLFIVDKPQRGHGPAAVLPPPPLHTHHHATARPNAHRARGAAASPRADNPHPTSLLVDSSSHHGSTPNVPALRSTGSATHPLACKHLPSAGRVSCQAWRPIPHMSPLCLWHSRRSPPRALPRPG